jgi:hypothetical protein
MPIQMSGRRACAGHSIYLRTELKLYLVEAGPGEQAGDLGRGEQPTGLVPRTGGTASISGMSWVTSCRWPPVSVAPGRCRRRR